MRCLEADQWTTVTSSLAEGVRFFTAFGRDLYGFTAPLFNQASGDPRLCHSPDRGVTWTCRSTDLIGARLFRLDSGRLVALRIREDGVTETWWSDDQAAHWTVGPTVNDSLTNVTVVGEVLYGAPLILDAIGATYAVRLTPPSVQQLPAPTKAHVMWLDLFAHDDKLFATTNRGVYRFEAGTSRWSDVAVESMPAIDVEVDARGELWSVDATGTARHLAPGQTSWDELFFDDTGWASGDVVAHATVYRAARIGDRMFFGSAHRKLFLVDTSAPIALPTEDLSLTAAIHPDAALWRLGTRADQLFVAPTGGEEVNHGNGYRVPWGGGLFRRTAQGAWSSLGAGLPQRVTQSATSGEAIVTALYVGDPAIVVATQAGVYRKADDAARFALVSGVPVYDALEAPTAIAGRGSDVLVARVFNGRTSLYGSTDGGAGFTSIASDLPAAAVVRALAAEAGTFYALVDPLGVLVSTDGGRRWTPVGTVADGASFPARTYALRVEADRIVVGSADGVWSIAR